MTRRRGTFVAAGAVLLAAAIVVTAAVVAGGFPYRAWGTGDPGAVVRLGAPVLRLVVDVCATVCVGALAYVVFLTGPQSSGLVSPQGFGALTTAGRWAVGWCLGAVCLMPFDAAATAGLPLSRVLTRAGMRVLFEGLEAPKAWVVTIVLTAVVAIGCRLTLNWRACAILLGVAVFAVFPPLAVGHSASETGHDLATAAIMVHVPAAMVWLGVLVALARAGRRVAGAPQVQRRYRRLGLVCWLLLAVSGAVDAAVLVPVRQLMTTGYGLLVLGKVVVFLALGLLALSARARLTRPAGPTRSAGAQRPGGLARLLAVELVLLAAAFGGSVALTALPPPAFLGRLVTGEETLLGYNLNGPPGLARLAFDWRIEVLFAPLSLALAVGYLLGVRRLRRVGRHWPAGRIFAWLGGCLLLLVTTSSGVGRYAPAMFSVQTVAHMVVGMVVPLLLVLGGPLTLAARTLTPAAAGGLPGPREWLEYARSSTLLRGLTQPVVCTTVFVGAPFLLYFTPAYDLVVRFHWAHLAMDAGFLAIGYLFAWITVGVDPLPRPMPDLVRLGVLLAAMPFDLVFGAAVIGSEHILGNGRAGANLYSALDLPWVSSLRADQRLGGGLALALGEAAYLATLAVLLLQWQRSQRTGRSDEHGPYDALAAMLAIRAGRLPAEVAQPQAVGDHQQGRHGHGGAGDQRVE